MNRITEHAFEGDRMRLKLFKNNSFHASLAALGVELFLRGASVEVEEFTGDLLVTHSDPGVLRNFDAASLTIAVRERRFVSGWHHSDPSIDPVVVAFELGESLDSSTLERFTLYLLGQFPDEIKRSWSVGNLVCCELNKGVMTPVFARRTQDALSFMF